MSQNAHHEPIAPNSTSARVLKSIGYIVFAGALLSFYGALFLIQPH